MFMQRERTWLLNHLHPITPLSDFRWTGSVSILFFSCIQYLTHLTACSPIIAHSVSRLLARYELNNYFPFHARLFHIVIIKTRFDLKLRIRTKRLKAFYSSERCDFTCVTWDAAHLHRNEYVPAGLNPQGGDALTTTTGLGWLPKLVPPGRTTHCCWQGSCTCLLIVKMALTVDWLVIL